MCVQKLAEDTAARVLINLFEITSIQEKSAKKTSYKKKVVKVLI
jgi:hypothetical protein